MTVDLMHNGPLGRLSLLLGARLIPCSVNTIKVRDDPARSSQPSRAERGYQNAP